MVSHVLRKCDRWAMKECIVKKLVINGGEKHVHEEK
jgi:hypothetical protein